MMPRNDRKQLRVVIYTRVSTEEQARKRISLRMQASRCRAYAKQLGWKLVKIISDPGYSGKDLRRPGVEAIRDLIKDGQADVLIVYRLDRLSRTLRHMLNFVDEDLAAEGVNFVSTSERFDTTSAAGRNTVRHDYCCGRQCPGSCLG